MDYHQQIKDYLDALKEGGYSQKMVVAYFQDKKNNLPWVNEPILANIKNRKDKKTSEKMLLDIYLGIKGYAEKHGLGEGIKPKAKYQDTKLIKGVNEGYHIWSGKQAIQKLIFQVFEDNRVIFKTLSLLDELVDEIAGEIYFHSREGFIWAKTNISFANVPMYQFFLQAQPRGIENLYFDGVFSGLDKGSKKPSAGRIRLYKVREEGRSMEALYQGLNPECFNLHGMDGKLLANRKELMAFFLGDDIETYDYIPSLHFFEQAGLSQRVANAEVGFLKINTVYELFFVGTNNHTIGSLIMQLSLDGNAKYKRKTKGVIEEIEGHYFAYESNIIISCDRTNTVGEAYYRIQFTVDRRSLEGVVSGVEKLSKKPMAGRIKLYELRNGDYESFEPRYFSLLEDSSALKLLCEEREDLLAFLVGKGEKNISTESLDFYEKLGFVNVLGKASYPFKLEHLAGNYLDYSYDANQICAYPIRIEADGKTEMKGLAETSYFGEATQIGNFLSVHFFQRKRKRMAVEEWSFFLLFNIGQNDISSLKWVYGIGAMITPEPNLLNYRNVLIPSTEKWDSMMPDCIDVLSSGKFKTELEELNRRYSGLVDYLIHSGNDIMKVSKIPNAAFEPIQ